MGSPVGVDNADDVDDKDVVPVLLLGDVAVDVVVVVGLELERAATILAPHTPTLLLGAPTDDFM